MDSVQNELIELGNQPQQPTSTTAEHAVVIPNDAMPIMPPVQCPPTISQMPIFNDQNFTQPELLIPTTTAANSKTWTFDIFTTSQMLLNTEAAYLHLDGVATPETIDYTGLPNQFEGFDGNQNTWDDGGFWSIVDTVQITINGTPVAQYQSGLLVDQLRVHPMILPQNYTGEYAYAYGTQMKTRVGDMGIGQFFNGNCQGAIKPYMDMSLKTATPASTTAGQRVFFDVPMSHLWYFFQTPGRFMSNEAKVTVRMQMKELEIRGTHVKVMGATGVLFTVTDGALLSETYSIPFSYRINNAYLVLPQYNLNTQTATALAAQNIPRPLTLLMSNVEILADPTLQNLDLNNINTWGKQGIRSLIKGSGILPKFVIPIPKARLTWGARDLENEIVWPYGIDGVARERTLFIPGFIYCRRVLIGGMPYYEDPVLNSDGDQRLSDIGGWIQYCQKRADKLQQKGNYLDAPDQKWLQLMANDRTLDPTMKFDSVVFFYGPGGDNRGQSRYTAALQYGKWMANLGLTGMSISQDAALDTISDTRTSSLEMYYYTAPCIDPAHVTTNGTDCFGIANYVSYPSSQQHADRGATNVPPTSGTVSLSWALPYPMMVSFGAGRQTTYDFLQTNVPALSSVPM